MELVPSSIVTEKKLSSGPAVWPCTRDNGLLNETCVLLSSDCDSFTNVFVRVIVPIVNVDIIACSSEENSPMAVTTPITRTNSREFARKVPVFRSATHRNFVEDNAIVFVVAAKLLYGEALSWSI